MPYIQKGDHARSGNTNRIQLTHKEELHIHAKHKQDTPHIFPHTHTGNHTRQGTTQDTIGISTDIDVFLNRSYLGWKEPCIRRICVGTKCASTKALPYSVQRKHTATHCYTLLCTATQRNTQQHMAPQHTATHYYTLQHVQTYSANTYAHSYLALEEQQSWSERYPHSAIALALRQHLCMFVCLCMCVCVMLSPSVCMCVGVWKEKVKKGMAHTHHINIHRNTHTHTHPYTHSHVNVQAHTHTNAHTLALSLSFFLSFPLSLSLPSLSLQPSHFHTLSIWMVNFTISLLLILIEPLNFLILKIVSTGTTHFSTIGGLNRPFWSFSEVSCTFFGSFVRLTKDQLSSFTFSVNFRLYAI